LAGQLRNGTTEKIELNPISTEERLRQLSAVYGCNGTEFLQNNGILQRQNGETATEWWKPGISVTAWSEM